MVNHSKQAYLPILIVLAWLSVMVFSFWWLEYRYWQPFSDSKVTFNGLVLNNLFKRIEKNINEEIVVIHFSDSECPCDSYSQAHISDLQGILKGSRQFQFSPSDSIMEGISIPATPAVAVWNKKGELSYFGPYSAGAFCGQGIDFVINVLKELKMGKNPKWINMLGVGCYCRLQHLEKRDAEF